MRLRPRSDAGQTLRQFTLEVTPTPRQRSDLVDLDGNTTLRLWFAPESTQQFMITAQSEVETWRSNPFDYLAEPWAATLPLDYPRSQLTALYPYLHDSFGHPIDAMVIHLAQSVWQDVQGNVSFFLTQLNQRIYESCRYETRLSGAPWPSGITWAQKAGSCRDFTMLMIDACRAVGLPARFVSGYQEGDPDQDRRDLHAWAEVFIPGGGWRGFDPTLGLAVADRHIAIAASPHPDQAAPVSGSLQEGSLAQAQLEATIHLELLADAPQ